MNRWIGKVAVVTGASAGIGAATVIDLVKSGMIVVGLARRVERIEALEKNIPKTATGKLYSKKCDVSNEDEVKCVFKWIEDTLGGVDVLVNNAAILTSVNTVAKDSSEAIRQTVNTNLLGTVWCIKAAYDSMLKRNVNGHIILINSILGHTVFQFANIMPSLNIYPATKHGVTALTEVLRQEMQMLGNKIKITSISPGFVRTEIFDSNFLNALKGKPLLESEDISAAILYVLGTPPHVQIHELTIKSIGEPV